MAGAQGGGDQDIMAWLIAGIIVLLGIYFAVDYEYEKYRAVVNEFAIWVAAIQIYPVAFISSQAQHTLNVILAQQPGALTWGQASAVLYLGGSYGRWWLSPLMLGGGYYLFRRLGVLDRYARLFTMKTLLQHNAKYFPALKPVAFRERLIIEEPPSQGPWRVAESPMLFAIRQGIILNQKGKPVKESWCFTDNGLPRRKPKVPKGGYIFSEPRALAAYQRRLGPVMPPMARFVSDATPRYIRGLAGAFACFAIARRKAGEAILDAMNNSFNEELALAVKDDLECAGDFELDIGNADEMLHLVFGSKKEGLSSTEQDLVEVLRESLQKQKHYLYLWLGELLSTCRLNGGSLPAHEFIWLRPTNRVLWYHLNPMGGNTIFAEGAAAWDMRQCNIVLGDAIPEGIVDNAVKALRQAIDDEGWFELKAKDK